MRIASDCPLRWNILVDSQQRIRFPPGIEESVPWLVTNQSVAAWLTIGPDKQALIAPDALHDEAIGIAKEAIVKRPLSVNDVADESAEMIRRLAAKWAVNFSYEKTGKKFSLTFPEPVRMLDICPKHKEQAHIISQGGYLEIWRSMELVSQRAKSSPLGADLVIEHLRDKWP